MANGKVCTGFSMPRVAKYAFAEGAVSYSDGMPLARGVEVSLEIEAGDDNNFYADNILAEGSAGTFSSGTVTLTVDGLKEAARKMILGITATSTIEVGGETVDIIDYDDTMVIPFVGIGFVVRFMEDGVTTYAPMVLPKCKFSIDGLSAKTQEESIDFQTQELTANIMRDDSATHKWRRLAADQQTEAAAVTILDAMLNITGA